jgi:beta-mannanase/ADP-ribosylglycohydrolase
MRWGCGGSDEVKSMKILVDLRPVSDAGRKFLLFAVAANLVLVPLAARALEPANPKASPKARAVLAWLAGLEGRKDHRLVSGQFTDCGPSASAKLLDEAESSCGRRPALIGVDYADFGKGGLETITPNRAAIEHWRKGGLVTVCAHLYSPVRGKGGLRDTDVDIARLLQPGEVRDRWMAELDILAEGLRELRDAGVVVLWRPFHEMNGGWFWWGGKDPKTFIEVWRHMFVYFSEEKGLDNLLWVYGPNHGSKTASYYAGDAFVDIVGLDAYTDDVDPQHIRGYEDVARLPKPFGFTEYGPHGSRNPPGDFDWRRFRDGVEKHFPRTVFFLAWNGKWSIPRNHFGKDLLEHPWSVNLEDLPPGIAGAPAASSSASAGAAGRAEPAVILDEGDYRDRVLACWLGKNIGGTLGMPVEGRQEMHDFTFYTPVPSKPEANDDLDLALLWMGAVEEHGAKVDARLLGGYWLRYVCVDWNEYGVGRANLRDGIEPPVSGQARNEKWRGSNGAWIRSETWACLLPGCPALAARYAFEDACVDHGVSEGTWAELFTTALQSAAFVERDLRRLIDIGLAWVPPGSAVGEAVRSAVDAHARGLDLKAARGRVVEVTKGTGWFQAPRNVGFLALGLLYGEGDFGKTVCATVNCGDDTDSTGATAGALMGILGGTKGIPEEWRKPVGEGIRNVAISGFRAPATVGEFTEQTVRLAKRMLAETRAPVAVRPGPASGRAGDLRLVDPAVAADLWSRSPWRVLRDLDGLRATLEYGSEPWIEPGAPRGIELIVESPAGEADLEVVWRPGEGLAAEPVRGSAKIPAGGKATFAARFAAPEIRGRTLRGTVEVLRGGKAVATIPFAFLGKVGVSKDDLALARLGARATSDSELDREPGCTPRAIDGIIAVEDDFDGKRWHSALTPHPHWIAVELPASRPIGRAVIHAADRRGYPVDFEGAASLDGKSWKTLFDVQGSKEAGRIERTFPQENLKFFRLTIRRSANPQFPDAAQVSEIELMEK